MVFNMQGSIFVSDIWAFDEKKISNKIDNIYIAENEKLPKEDNAESDVKIILDDLKSAFDCEYLGLAIIASLGESIRGQKQNNIDEKELEKKFQNIAQKICLTTKSNVDCVNVKSIGEAICLASGKANPMTCIRVSSIGEGICLASGKAPIDCLGVSNIAESLCLTTARNKEECSTIATKKDAEGKLNSFCYGDLFGSFE